MKNIFAKFQEYVKKPNRNTFDLQFRNNLTTKFGQLTPVFCKEVIPGDSFKIDTKFGLMLMPMKFPVQTPMKAYVHYFYVRNRTTYKDWQDFIGGTKENLVPPYVQPVDKKKFFRVGGLADYLGIPNTLYIDESSSPYDLSVIGANNTINIPDTEFQVVYSSLATHLWVDWNFLPYASKNSWDTLVGADSDEAIQSIVASLSSRVYGTTAFSAFGNLNPNSMPNPWNATYNLNSDIEDIKDVRCNPWCYLGRYSPLELTDNNIDVTFNYHPSFPQSWFAKLPIIQVVRNNSNVITSVTGFFATSPSFNIVDETTDVVRHMEVKYSIDVGAIPPDSNTEFYVLLPSNYALSNENKTVTLNNGLVSNAPISLSLGVRVSNRVSIIGDDLSSTPYDSDIHLSALPFRAYEAIYNAYYRNPQNNPFVLNGTPEYNRYVTTYDGGADTTQYDLYFRNWEYDFLTSAVQSPQQGVAPLVGMSMTGEATFADEEGNTYYAQAILNDQGEITGWQSHSSNMPAGSLRLLMDMAGTGISINDLRNVNAFQRFLENNIRHGLKYRDQIMSHFGVNVRYDELDMPEFLGGCSAEMEVYKVTQTSNSGDTPLGSFVGQAQVKKEYGHSITHYCDEHGFIIGIMSIVPIPVYSQLLPKFFTKSTQLDYFFPEFGHIGYQPILQKEVSPLQTFYTNGDLNKVFGYNRAWYDYLASTDEVHGQFRTTMRDFIMNRTFKDEPELGEDFLLVDPDQLNDVFLAGTDGDDLYAPEADKIIGSLLFNVSAKRPIPLFGIPKLEA